MSRIRLLIGFLILLLATVGCSEDPVTPPAGDQSSVRVELDPEGADFTIKLEAVSTPDSLVRGPFFLRGYNLHYDDGEGALVVDLTITNNSPAIFMDPVSITFHHIIPEGTLILNSPSGSNTFPFEFENDDLWWTPGEESLPLTVMFGVDPGVSVGFNGHISVGGLQDAGRISGRVWEDLNQDGIMDPDERGLGGVPIALDNGGPEEVLHLALTDTGGFYEFIDLEAGTYQVRVHRMPYEMSSTTSAAMHVLLAADDGVVSSFTRANFGFTWQPFALPGPKLMVTGSNLDRVVGYRGETIIDMRVLPGNPLHFQWEGFADLGLEIRAYRHGWDVMDPNDPNDPGWSVEPGLGPENMMTIWEWPMNPIGMHRLVIHCWDSEEHLTRVIFNLWLDGP